MVQVRVKEETDDFTQYVTEVRRPWPQKLMGHIHRWVVGWEAAKFATTFLVLGMGIGLVGLIMLIVSLPGVPLYGKVFMGAGACVILAILCGIITVAN